MFRKSKVKSATNVSKGNTKKSKLDNLHVSPSFLQRFEKLTTRKPKSPFSNKSPAANGKSIPTIPKDAAAHFGTFYGLREDTSGGLHCDEGRSFGNSGNSRNKPRTEFTRQMVHRLEGMTGTGEYARQVSALLEETVEPPNFKLNSLPAEDSIPNGRVNLSGFPLWYKEPTRTPFLSNEIYKILEEKYESKLANSTKVTDLFDDESPGEDAYEEVSEIEQAEEEEHLYQNICENISANKLETSANSFSGRSTSATDINATDSTSSNEEFVNKHETS